MTISNPYLQKSYTNPPQLNTLNQVAAVSESRRQIVYGGMIPVSSIEEVLKYPVEPGVCVHFKDTTEDYIYTKTQGFSQMEKPTYEAYHTERVDFESLLPVNKKLANYATVEQVSDLTAVISQLTKEIATLKNSVAPTYKPKYNKQRRDENEQKPQT